METYRKSRNLMFLFGMRVITLVAAVMVCLPLCATSPTALATGIFLDADTPATGSLLGTQPLVTSFGTITFAGEIRDRNSDPEFNAAGALGDVFDITGSASNAKLSFDFDIVSLTFIYGGNVGSILLEARNAQGSIVDSFFQASTDSGQPAGPITLSGLGIRTLYWEDPGFAFAPLDNINIVVPEPATICLLGLGGLLLRRRQSASKRNIKQECF